MSNSEKKCLQLDHGTWKDHSAFNEDRFWHSVVTTKTAIFTFGGMGSPKTYEYLPKGSTTWLLGKTEMPESFCFKGAIAVKSASEIWLIGAGYRTNRKILSFNVNDHTFQLLPTQLIEERDSYRCALIPNTNKIMVTGGLYDNGGVSYSTEIIDTEDGSVIRASRMNFRRSIHGMGVITNNGEDRLAVFGGRDELNDLDSIELYNAKTKEWEITSMKLSEPKSYFGFATVKLSDVIFNV